MKGNMYGSHRVIFPEGLLPQAAEKVDNNPKIFDNEILIDVIALQPTATAFGRIKKDNNGDLEKIKAEFMQIIGNAGKFQDPVTKSGGMLIGRIKEVGKDLEGKINAKVGDKIASLISLSATPLKVYEILDIDMDSEQVKVNADAILFESSIFTKLPEDIELPISLAMMDVCGAPAQVSANVKVGDTVVVVGAGKAGLLCLAEAKRRVGATGKVICMEYSQQTCDLVKDLGLADIVIQANCQTPLAAFDKFLAANNGELADFTVNTVNVPDTELATILVTKDTGKIYFFSMSTNFVKASLGAESVRKYVSMLVGNGFYPGHAEITFDIIRSFPQLREYFKKRYVK